MFEIKEGVFIGKHEDGGISLSVYTGSGENTHVAAVKLTPEQWQAGLDYLNPPAERAEKMMEAPAETADGTDADDGEKGSSDAGSDTPLLNED